MADWRRTLIDGLSRLLGVRNVYEGAQPSLRRSPLWQFVQDARLDISNAERTEILRKSRYWECNSPVLQRLADVFENYTVGTGLVLSPSSENSDWNKAASDFWTSECDNLDVTTGGTFGSLQALWARAWFVDGEVFPLVIDSGSGRPAVQTIESHRIETPPDRFRDEGVTISDGVVLNKLGRPVAYYVRDPQRGSDSSLDYSVHPARFMPHVWEPGRPGQTRGLPFIYSGLNRLHDIDDFQQLEMQAAKDNARISRYIKSQSGEIDPEAAMRGEVTQDPTKKQKYYDEVLGAEARALFPGDEVQQFPGERPSKNTRDYWQDQIALVCAAVGIPHQIAFPESIQGTVERSVLDMADAFFRARSGVIALASVNVYRLVLEWGIRTNAPGLRPAPPDWRRVTVRPPRSINVDLGYKSSAELKALAAGATNYDLIFGPLGLDWREEFRKLKEQIDYSKSIGLDLEELARVMKGGAPQKAAPGKKEDAE